MVKNVHGDIDDRKCSQSNAFALMGGDIENMNRAFELYALPNDKTSYALVTVLNKN